MLKKADTISFRICMMFAMFFSSGNPLLAQSFQSLQIHQTSLKLKAQGSFYIGGDTVAQTHAELGGFVPEGHISINQMYVRYMIPAKNKRHLPLVMIHGMALTGKCWETTPDGRMGWDEYFVRKGHAVYIPDQVGRGRSGFNQAIFNNVRSGNTAANLQPPMWRFSDENTWPNFRIGPKENVSFPGGKFPSEALNELSKQGVPDLSMTLPNPNPTYKALAVLAVQLKGAILVSHSQSGRFPVESGLIDSSAIKGMIIIEPGGSANDYSSQQLSKLAKIPILVIFGDNLDIDTGVPGHSWKSTFESWNDFVKRVNTANGNARMICLPEQGIRGNSHMLMQDKNNLQIADMILKWINENVKQ